MSRYYVSANELRRKGYKDVPSIMDASKVSKRLRPVLEMILDGMNPR